MLDDSNRLLESRFGEARPGLALVAIEPAALPVTLVNTDVLAQQHKPLALMNEFVLRLCEAGRTTIPDIAAMCGLEERLVEDTVAEEVSAGTVVYVTAKRAIALTPAGSRMCQELAAVQPIHTTLPIAFDRLVWRVADHRASELITKREAERLRMLLLPGSRTTRIGPDEVTAQEVNALLRGGEERSRVEVLSVRRLRPNTHRYLPVKLLIYADNAGSEVELALVVDDEHSEAHDLAIAALGGARALGINVSPPGKRSEIDPDLEALRTAENRPAAPTVSRTSAPSGPSQTDTGPVREIGVFEHATLLGDALDRAKRRILIVSPWVRSAVVDDAFINRLERRLRAGVTIHVAHGIGKDDRGSDPEALQRLASLQERHPGTFVLARLANSHAKILIYDDLWVSTSFNWLSFQGDPDRTYRMEEGILVTIPDRVTKAYNRYVTQVQEQRIG
jgi:hypothetical protein